ncbi:MAG TPA: GyrI-like domain-containing protein [Candidatus Cloacimonadota bacterium]|nr:GyrI-like domain-containing protein [Candidatus Cloacimonadota bacterium]
MRRYFLLLLLLLSFALSAKDVVKPEARYEMLIAVPLIGIQFENAMETQTMDNIWQIWSEQRSLLPHDAKGPEYGVFYYGDNFDPEAETGYYYMVGRQFDAKAPIPEGLVRHTIPGGFYAVFDYTGTLSDKERTYNYIYGEWIPANKAVPLMQDSFELYKQEYRPGADEIQIEIWIPLQTNGE